MNFIMRFFRRRQHDTNGHVPTNGNGQPAGAKKDHPEFERRVAEEARRYENDLRRLAKT